MKIKRKLINKCKIVLWDDADGSNKSLSTFVGVLMKLENDMKRPGFNKMDLNKEEVELILTILNTLTYETTGDKEPT